MTASAPTRRSPFVLWIIIAIVAAAAGALVAHFALAPKAVSDQAVETLFHTKMPDPAGAEVDLSKFRGKTLVVNFWAPWCGPCVEEMPELTALHGEYAPRNVEFVGIGIDSASNIQDFLKKVPVAYPLTVAGFAGTELSRTFGNTQGGLPFTVVITPDGTVKYRKMGRVHADELRAVLPGA
ncbi:thiol-disulfide isomerase/thioredoxin [Cupriavidus metallidurans]|jgi:thiol-disulfide isomerase/thioredoxin|uniref:Thioredoxin-like protein n=2 Tax=Cupriavidus metallidurans TaxID=119219 RepID=Q1LIU2_CUPMC|nr:MULTISPECIES: TlpA disulfide reductase family protein [Cupriavidus]PCH55061.1 MAG: TlpA family protein disulfide reductase [Burkholderiaceae bacterium]HBD32409.1 TlpA family protein disulfide reductase [Cupriavidus sp.]ABF09934.1 Thioredoxin-like protein [Cupriavidus metallidurans CH34]AVA36999.1 TlpA family protein disulfide reductase [Cupriavidus metallidurans]EKZ98901.1 Thioredoxin-like protein [Cupriavidus sp. HMR-1]